MVVNTYESGLLAHDKTYKLSNFKHKSIGTAFMKQGSNTFFLISVVLGVV